MKIKKYQPGLTAHVGPTPNVNAAMRELDNAGQAFKELGENISRGIGQLGKQISASLEKKKEENQNREFTDVVTQTEEAWQTFKNDTEQMGVDPDEYYEAHKTGWDTIIEDHEKTITDPEVKKAFRERMAKRWLTVMPEIANGAGKAWMDREAVSKIEQADKFSKLALNSKTKSDFELQRAALSDVFEGAKFIFGEPRAMALKKQYIEQLDKDRQSSLKDQFTASMLKDPTRAISDAIRGEWDELNEADRLALLEKARSHERHLIEVRRAEENRVFLEGHQKEEVEAYKLFATGKLNTAWLLNTQFLNGDERYAWGERLASRNAKAGTIKSNFKVLATFRQHIDDIETQADLEQFIKLLGQASEDHLNQEDAKQLLEKAMNRSSGIDAEYIKRAHRDFKAELAPSSGILGLPDVPEEWAAYNKAMIILDEEISLARRRGKPLSGVEIYNKGREILQMPGLRISEIEKAKILKERIKKDKEKAKSSQPALPPRNPGESISEYYRRLGIRLPGQAQ